MRALNRSLNDIEVKRIENNYYLNLGYIRRDTLIAILRSIWFNKNEILQTNYIRSLFVY